MPGTNVAVNHAFVLAKANSPDTILVHPSNWNANIKLGGGSGGQRFIRDPSQADGGAWVDPGTVRLTNRTGSAHVVGDVLVVDSGNDASVVANTTLASLKKAFVAMEANADAVAGIYASEGPVIAKATGSIARHQYVRLSATTKTVEDAGAAVTAGVTPPTGTMGIALAAASGGLVSIYLLGQAYQGPAAAAPPTFIFTPESAGFPAADFPELKKFTTGSWVNYSLGYDQTTDESAYWRVKIPTTAVFTAATLKIVSRQLAATSGTVAWQSTTATRSDGEDATAAGTVDNVAAATVKGTAGQLLFQTQVLTVTGWAAGEVLLFKLNRDVSEDTVAEDSELVVATIELS